MAALRDESDEALMQRYQQGDVRAFEVLLSRHEGPVYNFVLRAVGEPEQAADITQDVFFRVVRSAQSYERTAKFTTWLYTIARNLLVDAARRARFRRAASLDQPAREHDADDAPLGALIPHGDPPVDRQVIGKELGRRLEQALSELASEQREVFVMRELLGLPFKEIAEITGVSENTVKSRMRYALEKLRDALAEYQDLAEAVR